MGGDRPRRGDQGGTADGWGAGANGGSGAAGRGRAATGDAEAGGGMTGDGAPFHCPSCGEPLYARALVCPYCGAATPAGPSVRPRRPGLEAGATVPAADPPGAPPARAGEDPAASPGPAGRDRRIEPRFGERPAAAAAPFAAPSVEPEAIAPRRDPPRLDPPPSDRSGMDRSGMDRPITDPPATDPPETDPPETAAAESPAVADGGAEEADARTRFERELEAFDRRMGLGARDEDLPDPGFGARDFDDGDVDDRDPSDAAPGDPDGDAMSDDEALGDEEARRRFEDPEIVDAEFVEHRPATRDRALPLAGAQGADPQERDGRDGGESDGGGPDGDRPAGPPRRGVLDISPQAQAEPGAEAYRDLSVVPTRGGRELAVPQERRRGGGLALAVIAVLVLMLVGAGGAFVWKRYGAALAEGEGPRTVEVSKDWRPLDLGAGSPERWVVSADGPYRIRVDGVVYTVTGPVPFAVPLTGGRLEVRAVSGTVKVTATLRPN